MELQEMYDEISNVIDKYKDKVGFNVNKLKRISKLHILFYILKNKYGFNLNTIEYCREEYLDFNERVLPLKRGMLLIRNNGLNVVVKTPIYFEKYETDEIKAFVLSFNCFLKTYDPIKVCHNYDDTIGCEFTFNLTNGAKLFNDWDDIMDEWEPKAKEIENKLKIKELETKISILNGTHKEPQHEDIKINL